MATVVSRSAQIQSNVSEMTEHLVTCAAGGKVKEVKQALRRKSVQADINDTNSKGMTALGVAAQAGYLDVVTLLIQVSFYTSFRFLRFSFNFNSYHQAL